jgi:hypothetical protein
MAPRNHAPPEPGLKAAFIRGCFCTPRDHMTATRLLREQNKEVAQRSRMTRVFAQADPISCSFSNHSNI